MAKDIKSGLTKLQYDVTQNNETEPPFDNDYWNNHREGIYVDIVSGEPLFSSQHKYNSSSGWPSFFKPLEKKNIVERNDTSHGRVRTEVRSKIGDSHLGHLFDDGPKPTGKRYCINSAALRFIPKDYLVKEGYGQYANLFSQDEVAYFAGGCFWCVEVDFLKIKGVKDVVSGYLGGTYKNPTYEQVGSGKTGHAETVKVIFDPQQISYDDLLKVFWLSIDPTTKDRQFSDSGPEYRTAIFYTNDVQKKAIEESLSWLTEQFPNIKPVTEIKPAQLFYEAEDYHQRYAEKNPLRYHAYRIACGRDTRLNEIYEDLREKILAKYRA